MSRLFPKTTEHAEQVALLHWVRLHESRWPELTLLLAIPNGGHRHPAVAGKLKAEGVRSGIPDLYLPSARGGAYGLWIEMKAPGGKLSQRQKITLIQLREQGYSACVCYGWEDAARTLTDYLAWPRTRGLGAA